VKYTSSSKIKDSIPNKTMKLILTFISARDGSNKNVPSEDTAEVIEAIIDFKGIPALTRATHAALIAVDNT